MANAVGEDRSAYQPVGSWTGDAFAFAKATEGTGWKDGTFEQNWNSARGRVRGAYHFFHPAEDAVRQAQFFVAAVQAAGGWQPGDVFIADVEITVGEDGQERFGTARSADRAHLPLLRPAAGAAVSSVGPGALTFLQEVALLTGPRCRTVLYTDAYMAQNLLASCAAYPLFLAYYAPAPVTPAPWKSWTFWQPGSRGAGGGDLDYFNGSEALLAAWAQPAPKPLPPDWSYPPVRSLAARAGDSSLLLEWLSPAAVLGQEPMPGVREYEIAIAPGPSLSHPEVKSYPRYVPKGKNPESWQGGSLARRTEYTVGVRALADQAGPHDPHHAGPWATVTFSTT